MILGIDIGGTNLKIGVVEKIGNSYGIIDKFIESTPTSIPPEEFLRYLIEKIHIFTSKYSDIASIGIGFPGIISANGTIIIAPNIPKWNNYPFLEEISKNISTPTFIENDANTAGMAELYAGRGKGLDNFLYITLGTGIGAAIILDGKLYRGTTGNAGELGHTIVNAITNENQNSNTFQNGVLEKYAGKKAITQLAHAIHKKKNNSNDPKLNSVKYIEELANQGCEASNLTLETVGMYIGCGIASAMNFMDIHDIILGGGISKSQLIFQSINETLTKRTLPHIAKDFTLQNAKYFDNTGIVGAAIFGEFSGQLNSYRT